MTTIDRSKDEPFHIKLPNWTQDTHLFLNIIQPGLSFFGQNLSNLVRLDSLISQAMGFKLVQRLI